MLDLALHVALLLIFPPLLPGIIARVKAAVAGRVGPPLLQPYFDILKLLRKGAVYSRSATWIFRTGPVVSLAAVLTAGLILPFAAPSAPLGFQGDVVLFVYLLGLARFATMLSALDVGSSFEAMGASREAAFSALAEPALFLAIAIPCVALRSLSFEEVLGTRLWDGPGAEYAVLLAAAVALFAALLAENSRVPVDDPTTHLELTMVHEVMVLDHSGPDLAFITYGAAVKLFLFSVLIVRIVFPMAGRPVAETLAILLGGVVTIGVLVGLAESVMARLRLVRVPQFLIGASVLAGLALALLFHRGAA